MAGIGEVEIYEKPTAAGPTGLVATTIDKKHIKLDWQAPSGTLVQLRRKKFAGHGNLYNWPIDEKDGVLLYESKTGRSFVDKTAGPGKRWYYAVYLFNEQLGWSIIKPEALDAWCAACPNQNLAQDKPVTKSSVDATVTYGAGHTGVDGQRSVGPCTTDGAKLKKYNYRITFVVNLKKSRKIRKIVAFQPGGFSHFGMNYCQVWHSNSDGNWNNLGNKEMLKDHPGGLGYNWFVDITARFLKISCRDPTGYYFGFGELEVYEFNTQESPTLSADYSGAPTTARISWSTDSKAQEVVVRRTVVTEHNSRDSYPVAHDKGTEVYRGSGKAFTDVDLTTGTWYFYSIYAYNEDLGWSIVHTQACDAVQAGVSKQNWARGAKVTSNTRRSLTYGAPYEIGNGNLAAGPASTDYAKMKFGWRPSGYFMWVEMDLGKKRPLSKCVTHQKGWHFQSYIIRIYISDNNRSWRQVKQSFMDPVQGKSGEATRQVHALGGNWNARYIRLAFGQASGNYYYGAGEFEIYA